MEQYPIPDIGDNDNMDADAPTFYDVLLADSEVLTHNHLSFKEQLGLKDLF